ncbi:MAG: 4,5-DOPA dioxygenase extradiol [bacterium]
MNIKNKCLPVLFIGHGNPMNAIQQNRFTKKLTELGSIIPTPKSILCISAHWTTTGTMLTHMQNPKTIHDFYGFPKKLFDVQYPAPGNPSLAELIKTSIKGTKIKLDDEEWGLDHGTWSVLTHIYPMAAIPVVQMSLDMTKSSEYHFKLGQELNALRAEGVLIIGSGNIVHNLSEMDSHPVGKAYDWAIEFDEWVKQQITTRDYSLLINQATKTKSGKLSIPTWEHWYPLLYILGSSDPTDKLCFEYEGIDHGSISMRCLSFGL